MNETKSSITINFTGSITIPPHELTAIFEKSAKEALIQNLSPNPAPSQEMIVPKKLMYTLKDVAQLLSMSPSTVYRLIQRGLLQSSTASRRRLIPARSLERFVKNLI
jgi:excisionase family DNA binding protein